MYITLVEELSENKDNFSSHYSLFKKTEKKKKRKEKTTI